ncbi:MAG: 30S ribosomal protein S24e [Methanosarcinaceae archaeon]|nr:30S ribosomal protein S24e [Methanosarcinaceae archaeon]
MEIIIKSDRQNKLLNRRELDFVVKYEGPTPSRIDIRRKLSAILNTDLELTLIHKIKSEFGISEATGYAKIYDSKDRMKTVETKYILERNALPDEPAEPENAEDAEE